MKGERWRLDAACYGQEVDDFFRPQRARLSDHRDVAERFCVPCKVFDRCNETVHSFGVTERWGIWAGVLHRGNTKPALDLLADGDETNMESA